MTTPIDAVLSVHNLYFWPKPEATIAEIARVLRPGGRVLLVFRGREHPLPKRLDPAVYEDVTTDQCMAWLASAGFEGQLPSPRRRSPGGLLRVGDVLAARP